MLESITSWWSPAPEKPYDPTDPKQNPLNPKGLKPCCACPQTKSIRDDCFLKYGEEANDKCRDVVANHMKCMRDLGFKI